MKTVYFFIFLLLNNNFSYSQTVTNKLINAMTVMEKDEQFAHASIGLYVINSKTGAVVFDKNAQLGLAPASTQKVVTSAAAYELLGKDFTYKSQLGYDGTIANGTINGKLIFAGSGDPTLGSWRWKQTNENAFNQKIITAFKENKIGTFNGDLVVDESAWESQATPNGWPWDDIGNYYGAGVWGVNWRENQYDIFFKPGKNPGDPVELINTDPVLNKITFINELKTGKAGSGDNSIIYLPENGSVATIRGTLPAGADNFKVSGSVPNGPQQLSLVIEKVLGNTGLMFKGNTYTAMWFKQKDTALNYKLSPLVSFVSPPLDSINYWFMKESINLYGEAFVKTIAYQKKGFGATSDGLDIIKELWKSKGIKAAELKIKDGSGLSPANRLTPHALVQILQYASKQSWFNSFHHSLPLQNNIKMKSGYIGGVRSYAGYVKSKTGEEYTFAFIINNFDGSPSSVREKMWKLLDLLK